MRGRSHCITKTWKKSLRDLHDKLSLDILDLLPLPFLIVAGACPAAQLSKTFSRHTRRVEVPLTQDCTLAFDLLFDRQRIAAHHRLRWSSFGLVLQSQPLQRILHSTWCNVQSVYVDCGTRTRSIFLLQRLFSQRRSNTFSTGMLRNRAVNNHQLRSRLPEGDYFKCTAMKNGTPPGRVFVRDVHILVPPEADFNRVLVRCHLAPQRQQHMVRCSTKTISSDVANRPAIKIVYRLRSDHSIIIKWCKYQGQVIVFKLNSLIDFLGGNSEDFTTTQPWRFLARNKGRGRRKISFTSRYEQPVMI